MKKGLSIPLAIVALLLVFSPPLALAGSINAVLNGKSYHINSSHDWNEDNIGLGIEYEFEQKGAWKKIAMANGFRDSADAMSYMAGAGLQRRLFETDKLGQFYIYAGLSAFVMTREDVNNGNPFPGILPSISVGNSKFGANLTYMPSKAVEEFTSSQFVDPTVDGIVFLQFKVSLDQLLP
ncbi:MAG: hypothetical protein QNJ11_08315 [Woeseiaceae bacterium]|nr:hypothetical protein [Woeseiaceae bacterium]